MNDLAGCRYMERLCRQRAVFDHAHSWKWLGEAERWKDLAHLEVGDRFRETAIHPGPMAMRPNTIERDSRRQKHESVPAQPAISRSTTGITAVDRFGEVHSTDIDVTLTQS